MKSSYIALLRGINVSGQKKIKMAELRKKLGEAGLSEVQTYIQSGNILFQHEKADIPSLEKWISDLILTHFGYDVSVLIVTPAQLENIRKENPYLNQEGVDPKQLYFTFTSEAPSQDRITVLGDLQLNGEEWTISQKVIYLNLVNGAGRAKLSNNLLEQKLKVTATTRNLRTVEKLLDLSGIEIA